MLVYFTEKAWIWISIFLWGKNAFSNITANPGDSIFCAHWVAVPGSLQMWQEGCTDLNTELSTSDAMWGEMNSLLSSAQVSSSSMGDAEPGNVGCSIPSPLRCAGAHEVPGDILSFPSGCEYKEKNHSEMHPTLLCPWDFKFLLPASWSLQRHLAKGNIGHKAVAEIYVYQIMSLSTHLGSNWE